MPDGPRCEFPGCDEAIVQPAPGGPRRLYCSYDHRAAARRLRSIARFSAGPVPEPEEKPFPDWITDPFAVPGRSNR
jgi:hypothetical protein